MNTKFIIITTSYNIEKWLPINILTTKFQSYTNFECVIVDDNSTDNSYQVAKSLCGDDTRFHVIKTPEPSMGQGEATVYAIDYIKPNKDDVILEVDGDDWLSSVFVLDYLNSIYKNPDIWMTYGQYMIYPSAKLGGHYNQEISDIVDFNNQHRDVAFPFSHLKTYKSWLFDKIDRRDLIDPTTGKIYRAAFDHALCLPMVEMAGKTHIFRCDDILYVLNRSSELLNEGKTRLAQQKDTEHRIRNQKKYMKL